MNLKLALALAMFVALTSVGEGFRNQRLKVKGRLLCGDDPAAYVPVKLVDYDTGPDPDDYMDSGETDEDGRFELSGRERELTNIDGEIRIYHDCNDHGRPCQREWQIGVPDKYINTGKTFDLGTVNLEVEPEGEKRDCFNFRRRRRR